MRNCKTHWVNHASNAENIHSGASHDHATKQEHAQVQRVDLAAVIKPNVIFQLDSGSAAVHAGVLLSVD